jgi:hypothetical protein
MGDKRERRRHLLVARRGGHRTAPALNRRGTHNARSSYEQYLALAQGESRVGNTIAAENYYQHAEHYFRLMSSDQQGS